MRQAAIVIFRRHRDDSRDRVDHRTQAAFCVSLSDPLSAVRARRCTLVLLANIQDHVGNADFLHRDILDQRAATSLGRDWEGSVYPMPKTIAAESTTERAMAESRIVAFMVFPL
jgi:hypothetical protein